ncbi:MAG: tRNA (guanosine(46)-N7)-methyltransferase TrmB [Firmicutes bacterium]|nr:tRNA (guanosine(46)-N7)-methyltransferase TrmB [Bacillota bacterium]
MRIRKKNWFEAEMSSNNAIIENPSEYKGHWSEFFGNSNPIHIEIGCGKGQFLSAMSKAHPDINYIGIEREPQIIVTALKKSRLAEVGGNIDFFIADVANLAEVFAPGEISRIYTNFADPWHRKRKWAKRRLTHRNFLDIYEGLFGENGGELFMKTDNTVLFEFSLNEIADKGWRLHNISLDLHNSDFEGNIMTEFEEKFSSMGMPIYRLEGYYKKLPEDLKK